MDWDEATSLASTLRIGSLSLKLEEINSSVVGAQLGSAAVSTSVKAGAIGIVLIILFLQSYIACLVLLPDGHCSSMLS